MRIQVFSDLHLDLNVRHGNPVPVLRADADALVVAGDVCQGAAKAVEVVDRIRHGRDVLAVLVLGNHEFYGRRIVQDEIAAAHERARELGVSFLENGTAPYKNVYFLGATLWSDYLLYGEASQAAAEREAMQGLNDFHGQIWARDATGAVVRWNARMAEEACRVSKMYIRRTTKLLSKSPTVVVTHNGCHPLSIHPRYRDGLLSAAFINDFSKLIEERNIALWIHGHTHCSFDYVVPGTSTRVVCNPMGYAGENPEFDPLKIVEIEN